MSHFSVLVIVDEPTEEAITKALAPYHEFECTGLDDEFVKDFDVTAECRAEYDKEIETRSETRTFTDFTDFTDFVKDWHGNETVRLSSKAEDDALFELVKRPGTPQEGSVALDKLLLRYPLALKEKHKYGYVVVDSTNTVLRVIRRTNKEKKWDWWRIGGRFGDFFRLKPGKTGISFRLEQLKAELAISKEICNDFLGGGGPGNFKHHAELATAIQERAELAVSSEVRYADIAFRCDIDVEGKRNEAEVKARTDYDKFLRLVEGLPKAEGWETILAKHGAWDKARDEYHAQPAIQAMRSDKDFIWASYESYNTPLDAFIARRRAAAFLTFAVVKDRTWYQRGEMGWWGCVSGDIGDEWQTQFQMLIDDLPGNAVLAVVDCHI